MELREKVERRLLEIMQQVPPARPRQPKNKRDFRKYVGIECGRFTLRVKFDRERKLLTCFCEAGCNSEKLDFGTTGKHGLVSLSIRGLIERVNEDTIPRCVVVKQGEEFDSYMFRQVISRSVELIAEQDDKGTPVWKQFYDTVKYCAGLGGDALSKEAITGLIGELAFMKEFMIEKGRIPGAMAVDMWKGPLKAPKDFLATHLDLEVKSTISEDPTRIKISNRKQLETTGKGLVLAHCKIVGGARCRMKCDTLNDVLNMLISSILMHIDSQPFARTSFLHKLLILGVKIEDAVGSLPEVDNLEMSWKFYSVCSNDGNGLIDFPRITTSSHKFPEGIMDLSYDLSLAALEQFTISESEVITRMSPNSGVK